MQKKKIIWGVIAIVCALILLISYTYHLYLVDLESKNATITLSLADYQVGQLIESGDFILWNRKTGHIDYCIKDTLNRAMHFQTMKIDQMKYDQYFNKTKEKP